MFCLMVVDLGASGGATLMFLVNVLARSAMHIVCPASIGVIGARDVKDSSLYIHC